MLAPRMRTLRRTVITTSLAALLVGTSVALAGGPSTTTLEAGAILDYVAPDPGTSTPGEIRFGFTGPLEVIAADAELVPPADTNLAFLNGGTPTCLEVTRDGAGITRLAFVAECTVSGDVSFVEDVFGPGADGYMIADRLIAPAEFLADSPEFAALIGVPASAGTVLSVTFAVDVDLGFPVTFVGSTSLTGPVTLLSGGDVMVDGATLPSEVIDDVSRAALTEAAELGVDATVEITGNGNLQTKSQIPELEISLAVSYISPTPTPAPSVPAATAAPSPSGGLLPDTRTAETTGAGTGIPVALIGMLFVLACAGVRARARAWVLRGWHRQ